MFTSNKFTYRFASFIILLSLTFSGFQPVSVAAQSTDGIKRQLNAESGRVSFIGPESGLALSAARALGTFIRPQDPAMALANRYAPEFGIQDPARELTELKISRPADRRVIVRYQQTYQGVPVVGGELIVNTNQNGDLYSMNGEVSPNLSLPTQPTIASAQATQTALDVVAKWYDKTPADFVASEPELWIFDESLLQPSNRPVELVWRMEVSAVNNTAPVRELVLINAQRGSISLHFNQIDNAWAGTIASNPVQTSATTTVPSTSSERSDNPGISQFTTENIPALAPITLYVATTGNDSNFCTAIALPCLTINGAIGKAVAEDTIKVAVGIYYEQVLINKNLTVSGGWNSTFTTQSDRSTIDGQGVRKGIASDPAIVTIDRFIIQNGSDGSGGGIDNYGTLTINNSIIRANTNTSYGSSGGGIKNQGTLILNNSAVSNNTGTAGAGINNQGTLTLNNSTVNGNSSTGFWGTGGGGIYNNGTLTINNSTISGNQASAAGGGSAGGGIYSYGGTVILNNSTVASNSSSGASGGVGGGILNGSSLTINNSIIARNTATTSSPDCSGLISSGGYNLIGNNSNCTFSATSGDLVGTSASPINPRLTPLQDNGGPTFTHALMFGSPAIDAGNAATCLSTDQRGVARPVGVTCDIGAYEGSVPWVSSPLVNTYTANLTSSLPGTFLCNQTQPNCTNGSNAHADAAHKFATGTYIFYATLFNRDSIDNNGMTIVSTVQYCSPYFACPYANAYWSGTQMVYGGAYGFPLADDVVAHELTHGVTQYESNLFPYYQSGAIDESFADLFGEYYDQTNGLGTDGPGVKWLLGEDVTGLGAIRSLSNPPAYGDPDKMTSTLYRMDASDNGGIHHNSGVNNKAVFLMVDGGTFNGRTVSALGWEKAGAIYYEANTNLLPSGADYSDLYYALQQACTNQIGQKGITSGDCTQVKNALDAVEMSAQPTTNFNTDAPLCGPGQPPSTIFYDDLENGTGNWTINNGGTLRWQYDSPYGPYAHSGAHSLYSDDYPPYTTDATVRLTSIAIPANAYLSFHHAYDFEAYLPSPGPLYFDGGVLEYSTNSGSSWVDAGLLIDYNGYTGVVYPGYVNPLQGRTAFVSSSHGYISTRLNLASLAGQTVTFRWRMGLDDTGASWGWWLDDVHIFDCISRTISGNVGTPGVKLNYTDGIAKSVTSAQDGNYSFKVSNRWSGTVTPTHACFTFNPTNSIYNNVITNQTAQNYTPIFNAASGCANINVDIGGVHRGTYGLPSQGSQRVAYALDAGPVKVTSTNGVPLIAALRDAWKLNGQVQSFAQLMGLPQEQLSDTYLFPAYNNVTLDEQIRFANVDSVPTTVTVTIAGVIQGTYTLQPNESKRVSYALDAGPVEVQSSGGVKIIAAIRDAWKVNGQVTSFVQIMGLPKEALSDTYLFPAYNNVTLDGQLRFGNVDTIPTTVTVTIAGVVQGSYALDPSESQRVSYPLDAGPVEIPSSGGAKIIAALRDAWKVNGQVRSFAQLMGLPKEKLSDSYLLPAYNNVTLDGQLRFGNVDTIPTTVTVTIAGVVQGTYALDPSESQRVSYPLDAGPVEISSSNGAKIIVAIRDAWKVNGQVLSFVQMMGLPQEALSTTYWFPAYNNVTLDGQLRFGVP